MRIPNRGLMILAVIGLLSFARGPWAGAAPAPGDSAGLLTKDEAKEVDALLAAMITAGFPDTEKATVYSGTLSVSATYDPGKEPPPLPTSASRTQMTIPNSNKVTYGYVFPGLHFKLADGSWVISLSYHFKPRAGDNVGTAQATEVNLATLTADASAAHPFDAEKMAGKYLQRVSPAQRDRCKAMLNRMAPITNHLKLGPNLLPPAIVLLKRAGWSDAAELSLIIADQRARNYWQLKAWTTPDPTFDPTGAYPTADAEATAWDTAHPQFITESPQIAMRRAMFRWCRAQMMVEDPEDTMLPIPAAAAACKAALDPKDPQNNAARIDALAAGAKLPASIAPDAPLATRLQSWETRARMPRMVVKGGGGGQSPQISTSFEAPAPAYKPDKADLDALIALLADERPSRFFDSTGGRPVGDNAWRALAILLNSDPRTLAGYPTDHSWTAAERKAAAKAVQAWWKEHRKEFVEK